MLAAVQVHRIYLVKLLWLAQDKEELIITVVRQIRRKAGQAAQVPSPMVVKEGTMRHAMAGPLAWDIRWVDLMGLEAKAGYTQEATHREQKDTLE